MQTELMELKFNWLNSLTGKNIFLIISLKEESYIVQLQILNAAVKTFLKTGTEESYNILQQIFEFTSKETDNPDLRERGFIYWRLLTIDPNLASQVVLTEKPRISEDTSACDSTLLDVLVNNLGTLASIYSKPPELFVKKTKKINLGEEDEGDYEESAINVDEPEVTEKSSKKFKGKIELDNSEDNFESYESRAPTNKMTISEKPKQEINLIDLNDIIGGGSSTNTNNPTKTTMSLDMLNLFDNSSSGTNNLLDSFSSISVNTKKPAMIPKQQVLNENTVGYVNKNRGLVIEAALQRENSGLSMYMTLVNKSNSVIQVFFLYLSIGLRNSI
jgi:hypothetical protein